MKMSPWLHLPDFAFWFSVDLEFVDIGRSPVDLSFLLFARSLRTALVATFGIYANRVDGGVHDIFDDDSTSAPCANNRLGGTPTLAF